MPRRLTVLQQLQGGWDRVQTLMQWFSMRTSTEGYSQKSTMSFCPSCNDRNDASSCIRPPARAASALQASLTRLDWERPLWGTGNVGGTRPLRARTRQVVRVVEEEIALAAELHVHRVVRSILALRDKPSVAS